MFRLLIPRRFPTVRFYSIMQEPPIKKTKLDLMQLFLKEKPQIPKKPLVWVDCEMTGLDVFGDDNIIEICCIITNEDLDIVDENG